MSGEHDPWLQVFMTSSFRLHVAGLPKNITESELAERFRSFGTVQSVEIIKDQFDGKYKRTIG